MLCIGRCSVLFFNHQQIPVRDESMYMSVSVKDLYCCRSITFAPKCPLWLWIQLSSTILLLDLSVRAPNVYFLQKLQCPAFYFKMKLYIRNPGFRDEMRFTSSLGINCFCAESRNRTVKGPICTNFSFKKCQIYRMWRNYVKSFCV